MWTQILREFADSPSQTMVVKYFLENGLGINEKGRIVCNGIEIPATHIAKKIGTDRRVIDATAKRILSLKEIRDIFLNLRVTPDLTQVADALGLAVITIYPKDAAQKGIVGAAVKVITDHNLSIRQIFVTDPILSEDPKLVVILESNLPATVYEELRSLPQVRKIII
ncbi:regulator of amino acid metabolism, contains ACT domain protein [Methanolacinia paynteri]|uniref:regulator of amino acid metabolism, contains ACT domain protein n=1 Tax=Methanolacinia paynteri TaxID=230356 RepID=UPI00064E96F5|nr:regulator of amino acid metabolism, contains ACT domain protein [Methanolacinia paynteri]